MRKITVTIPVPEFNLGGFFGSMGKALRRVFRNRGDFASREVPSEGLIVKEVQEIEFEKPLYSPEADPESEIVGALGKLKRQRIDCPVSIINGSREFLFKSIKLPPIERRKVKDVVQYEARQNIPFELDQVEWRWMMLNEGETVDDDFHFEAEILISAIKKEAIARGIVPFLRTGFRTVDSVQSRLLLLLEFVRIAFNQEDKPFAVLEIHSESSQIVVVDGSSFWQREIPLGGAHFTRALSRELQVPIAKAEVLKLNAMDADDPKLIFQCLRPVFNDLVTEIQRSLGFYRSLKQAKTVEEMVFIGNSTKLPGLIQYLMKNLDIGEKTRSELSWLSFADAVSDERRQDYDRFIHPTMAAIQRLGFGHYRENFAADGRPFGIGEKSAWGVEIGNHGLTAVKVERVD